MAMTSNFRSETHNGYTITARQISEKYGTWRVVKVISLDGTPVRNVETMNRARNGADTYRSVMREMKGYIDRGFQADAEIDIF